MRVFRNEAQGLNAGVLTSKLLEHYYAPQVCHVGLKDSHDMHSSRGCERWKGAENALSTQHLAGCSACR